MGRKKRQLPRHQAKASVAQGAASPHMIITINDVVTDSDEAWQAMDTLIADSQGSINCQWRRYRDAGGQRVLELSCPDARQKAALVYPGTLSVLDALYYVEQHQKAYPGVIGAMFVADKWLRAENRTRSDDNTVPHLMAILCRLGPAGAASRLSRVILKSMVTQVIGEVALGHEHKDVSIPRGSVNRARYWLLLASELWQSDTLKVIAPNAYNLADTTSLLLGSTAMLWLRVANIERLQVAGVSVDMELAAIQYAWPQVLEWVAGDVTADVLRWLTHGRLTDSLPTVDRPMRELFNPDTQDVRLMNALTASLLREAGEKAVYVPYGHFYLEMPEGLPLRSQWSVQGLRLWALPDGFWVSVIDKEGQRSSSFRWTVDPDTPLRTWVISADAMPVLDVTLAALWHDLRIAGEKAVPSSTGTKQRRSGTLRRDDNEAAVRQRAGKRVLPSRRLVLQGRRQWGTRNERRTIQRRSHGVRGHLRQLPEGWKAGGEAKALAVQFGMVVPEGYTFVRPHVRGGERGTSGPGQTMTGTEDTIIVSRGLATVLTLMQATEK